VSSSGRFRGGLLTTRDIPMHNIDQLVSTYQGDLEVAQPAVDLRRTN
jgi:hypothetical protein